MNVRSIRTFFYSFFMETRKAGIPSTYHILKPKSLLMLSRHQLNRIIVIGFMVLVGYALAKAFYHNSIMGILLGFTSLGAGVYFLYLLAKAKEEMEAEENA
jgi:hypothetical protein